MKHVGLLGRRFTDAFSIIGGCSVIGGIIAWACFWLRQAFTDQDADLEHWVLNGGGLGGIMGLLIVCLDFIV